MCMSKHAGNLCGSNGGTEGVPYSQVSVHFSVPVIGISLADLLITLVAVHQRPIPLLCIMAHSAFARRISG